MQSILPAACFDNAKLKPKSPMKEFVWEIKDNRFAADVFHLGRAKLGLASCFLRGFERREKEREDGKGSKE